MTLHPPGTIAIPVGEMGRYSSFSYSLAVMQYPPGTRLSMMQGLSIPRNLNNILREATGEWVWFLGDDHTFEPDLLIRLLDRDVDVVVPLVIRRRPPFGTVIFKGEATPGEFEPFGYDELPETGMVPVYAAGTAGMLVRKWVLDEIGDPWFENSDGDVAREDLNFCARLRELGVTIHADMEAHMGHVGLFTVRPHYQQGSWGILFDMGPGPDGALNTIYVRAGARYITQKGSASDT